MGFSKSVGNSASAPASCSEFSNRCRGSLEQSDLLLQEQLPRFNSQIESPRGAPDVSANTERGAATANVSIGEGSGRASEGGDVSVSSRVAQGDVAAATFV